MVINHLLFLVKHSLPHLSFSLILVYPWHWWSKFFLAGSADSAYKVVACHLCTTRVPAIRDGTWCTEIDLGLISRRTISWGAPHLAHFATLGTLGTLVSLSTKCTQANFDRAEHGRRVHRVSALCTVWALCTDRAPKASESWSWSRSGVECQSLGFLLPQLFRRRTRELVCRAHKISPRIGSLLAIEKKPDLIKKENTISSRIRSLPLLRLTLNVLSPSLCFLIKLTCCLAPISLLLSKDALARGYQTYLLLARLSCHLL